MQGQLACDVINRSSDGEEKVEGEVIVNVFLQDMWLSLFNPLLSNKYVSLSLGISMLRVESKVWGHLTEHLEDVSLEYYL